MCQFSNGLDDVHPEWASRAREAPEVPGGDRVVRAIPPVVLAPWDRTSAVVEMDSLAPSGPTTAGVERPTPTTRRLAEALYGHSRFPGCGGPATVAFVQRNGRRLPWGNPSPYNRLAWLKPSLISISGPAAGGFSACWSGDTTPSRRPSRRPAGEVREALADELAADRAGG